MKYCKYCHKSYTADQKYCNTCGRQLKTDYSEIWDKFKNVNMRNAIPLLSATGLIIILYSLFVIFQEYIFEIEVNQLIIGGYSAAFVMLIISVVSIVRKIETSLSVTFLMLFEGLTYLSTFFYDIVYRDEISRHTLLIVALVLSILGIFIFRSQVETTFQQIHRVIAGYMGWITVLYTGGSSYIDPFIYTTVILALVLVLHGSGFRFPSLPVIGSSLIIETLVLFDTEVINTAYLLPIAFLHVILLPGIFLLQDAGKIMIGKGMKNIKAILSVYFLPLIPIYLAMSRGAIAYPYTHILVGVFAAAWLLYFTKSLDSINTIFKYIITAILILILLFYVVNNTNVVSMEVLILLLLIRFLRDLDYAPQIRTVVLFISLISTGKFYYNGLDFIMVIAHMMIFLVLVYLSLWNKLKSTDISFVYLFVAANLSMLYVIRQTSVYNIAIILGLLILTQLHRVSNLCLPINVASLGLAITAISAMTYNMEQISTLISLGLLGYGIIIILSFIENSDVIGWILPSLPLVLYSSSVVNHWLLNITILLVLSAGMLYFLRNQLNYSYLIFIFEALWIRMINHGEDAVLLDYSVWSLSVLAIYLFFGVMILYSLLKLEQNSIGISFLMILWLISGFFIGLYQNYFNDLLLDDATWMISQIGFIVFLVMTYMNWGMSTVTVEQKILHSSILGVLNYVLLLNIVSPWMTLFGNLITLLLLMLGNRSKVLRLQVLLLYLAGLFLNLIGFSMTTRWGRTFFPMILFLILGYSRAIAPLFDRLGELGKDLGIYALSTSLVLIFLATELTLLLDGVLVFQLISLLTFWKIHAEKAVQTMIQPLIYILTNVLLMSTAFELDSELLNLVDTEIILLIVRGVLTLLMWANLLIIAMRNDTYDPHGVLPELGLAVITTSTGFIILFITTALQLAHLGFISDEIVNQLLAAIMAFILVLTTILQRRSRRMMIDALLAASFVVLLQSTLVAFFLHYLAIIILSVIALAITITAMSIEDRNLMIIAIALYVIIFLKFILDLLILGSVLEKGISGITTGIDIMWLAIIYRRITLLISNTEN